MIDRHHRAAIEICRAPKELEMLPILAAAIGLPIAAILALAASKPSAFRVERRARIDAPP